MTISNNGAPDGAVWPRDARAPRVVLFNVAYSENVGDGVIAECMAHALRARGAEVAIRDLSGRGDYGERTVRARTLVLALLNALPRPIRRRLVRARLERTMNALEPDWDAVLSGADLAVIGGGNLFQDDGLNFPIKVAAAARACARNGVPVRVHAVGVAGGWSSEARELFAAIDACDLRGASVRDAESADAWREEGACGVAAQVVRDPGLLAEALLPCAGDEGKEGDGGPPAVGLGVLHPTVAAHHAHRGAMIGGAELFGSLAERMMERGWRVRLFSNGARDDHALAERVLSMARFEDARRDGRIELLPRPRTATDLVGQVAGLDGLIAHRLHALIVATGLGVPAVGLPWDDKVRRFFASIDRPGDVARPGMVPAAVAALLARVMAAGADDDRSRLVREARGAVEALLEPVSGEGATREAEAIRVPMEAEGA